MDTNCVERDANVDADADAEMLMVVMTTATTKTKTIRNTEHEIKIHKSYKWRYHVRYVS